MVDTSKFTVGEFKNLLNNETLKKVIYAIWGIGVLGGLLMFVPSIGPLGGLLGLIGFLLYIYMGYYIGKSSEFADAEKSTYAILAGAGTGLVGAVIGGIFSILYAFTGMSMLTQSFGPYGATATNAAVMSSIVGAIVGLIIGPIFGAILALIGYVIKKVL